MGKVYKLPYVFYSIVNTSGFVIFLGLVSSDNRFDNKFYHFTHSGVSP
jgi:hypothetical protein